MSLLHTVGRIAVLAIVAAGIAVVLFFVAVYIVAIQIKSPSQPGNVVPKLVLGHVEVTPGEPVTVQRFAVSVTPYGDSPTATVDIQVDALPDELSISVVRGSDTSPMVLGPSDRVAAHGGIGGQLRPFDACGPPGPCSETFTVTFRLVRQEPVSVDWRVYLTATYTKPVQTDEGVRVTIER